MFLNLPVEVQQTVFDSLDVKDRTKLNMALPKEGKMKHVSSEKEKKLGILYRAITKKTLTHLTPTIKGFLRTCDVNDVTLKAIAAEFPEERIIQGNDGTLLKKIRDGTATSDDFEFAHEYRSFDLLNALCESTPTMFDIAMSNTRSHKVIMDGKLSVVFNMFNWGNEELIAHILSKNYLPKSAWDYFDDVDVAFLLDRKIVRDLILKYRTFTQERLRGLYEGVLGAMDVEAALDIEKVMMQM